MKAAREKKADIIVLCSSDDEYATFAPEAFKLTRGKELFVNLSRVRSRGSESSRYRYKNLETSQFLSV